MIVKRIGGGVTALAALVFSVSPAAARDLTFQERVEAQESIERVYYAHLKGATRPFEEAVTRSLLERKVRTYLRESAALEAIWSTPVTAEMLGRELERMARRSRMPERLRELYAALRHDPVLIQECLARPVLVGRLTRNFFASDRTIHEGPLRRAETLRDALRAGRVDPHLERPGRIVADLVRAEAVGAGAAARPVAGRPLDPSRIELPDDEFGLWSAGLPARPGEPGPLVEERERISARVVLERGDDRIRVASFTFEKRGFEEWWADAEKRLDPASVGTAVSGSERIPVPVGRPGESWDDEYGDPLLADALRVTAEPSCTTDDTWDNGAMDDVPAPRQGHSAVWTGSLMVIWGGYVGTLPFTNTGARYDPATDTWTPTALTGAPSGRADHSAVWTGSAMIVWSGTQAGTFGGRYDPVSNTWALMSRTNAPAARAVHSAIWTGSRMVVWGGCEGSLCVNTGGSYDPATDTWAAISTLNAPAARGGHSTAWTGSVMMVWGGNNLSTYYSDGSRYSPATDTWTPMASAGAPSPRSWHSAVWTGSRMIVWGGDDGVSYLDTGARYDPAANAWIATSRTDAPSGRYRHTAVWTGSLMVVWGGINTNTGGRYDPASDSWTPTSLANAPSARPLHTAVWTGSLMIVWGGENANTGGRYNPATDTWTGTSTSGAPQARAFHSAVWTGSLMVVWGGNAYLTPLLDTGGRYDPALDDWTPTSRTGAPSGRYVHSAVWTGSRMIVWGGRDGVRYFDTGARYDPLSDSWTPMTTVEAPTGRFFHAAVWTGAQMIVWGGTSGAVYFKTGGRYDPATDTWVPTDTGLAPSPRHSPSALWTGTRMIVWGGFDGSYLNSGGKYDPTTDTWAPTSLNNVITGRSFNTVVWTGSLMVVWGGEYELGYLDSGGRYDPIADTWAPTSLTLRPSARSHPSSFWTGSRMVVWGGFVKPSSYLNTGGRYDPANDTWTRISTINSPPGRAHHTAVYTGRFMIVWGGNNGFDLNGGGRYCVCADCSCPDGGSTLYQDADSDGFGDPTTSIVACSQLPGYVTNSSDCDDTLTSYWALPGEARDLMLTGPQTLVWSPPGTLGGTEVAYDLLRSPFAANFIEPAVCSKFNDPQTQAEDAAIPELGTALYFLVRAENACGLGPLTTDSQGRIQPGRICP